jgi:uncharacterized membrane protein
MRYAIRNDAFLVYDFIRYRTGNVYKHTRDGSARVMNKYTYKAKHILSQTVSRVTHVMYWAPVIAVVYVTALVYLHRLRKDAESNTNNNSITQ